MRSTPKCDIVFLSSGGFVSMKTKIIYISGNEVFNMADIRAAFEEVRATLGLGTDTVMFGVPVDNDDALGNADTNVGVQDSTIIETVTESVAEPVTESDDAINENVAPVVLDKEISDIDNTLNTATEEIAITDEKPVRKSRRTKATSKKVAVATETPAAAELSQDVENNNENSDKIIPILSVLAKKEHSVDAVATEQPADGATQENNAAVDTSVIDEPVASVVTQVNVADIDIDAEFNANGDVDEHNDAIADMITDDAPDAPVEKTLEQLLESMTPLREDIAEEPITPDADATDTEWNMDDMPSAESDATDATLEQLAAEFAENQDKIPSPQKTESHSKIGKLKNILPFKKAKRDDSGLMGDLFGWAGIAANDDDFAIPGFFTKAASKK